MKRHCEYQSCQGVHLARGYCASHYRKFMKGELLGVPAPDRERCKEPDCIFLRRTRGYCERHYNQYRRGKLVGVDVDLPLCLVPSCKDPSIARGYCNTHYQQFRRKGFPRRFRPRNRNRTCTEPDCQYTHYAKGFCEKHYRRFLRKKPKMEVMDTLCRVTTCRFDRWGCSAYCRAHRLEWWNAGGPKDWEPQES
jgi:hypothetical protein